MSSPVLDEIETKGLTIRILGEEYIDECFNPRTNGDCQLGTMYCWHPRYELGDEQFTHDDHPECETLEEVAEELKRDRKAINVLPLVLLDHSGLTIRVGTSFAADPGGWDTTLIGFIYTTQERIDELGCPADSIESQLRAEVEEYDAYLRGEVYRYEIVANADEDDEEVLESCGGFVGDIKHCEEAAREEIGYYADKIASEAEEAAHWAARDTVTVTV